MLLCHQPASEEQGSAVAVAVLIRNICSAAAGAVTQSTAAGCLVYSLTEKHMFVCMAECAASFMRLPVNVAKLVV